MWAFITIFLSALFVAIMFVLKSSGSSKQKPIVKTVSTTNWVIDCDCADKYFKYYRDELEENSDYLLSAKELKEDFEGEKVYKYYPLEVPLQMDGLNVYSKTDGEWEKIGRLKKTATIDGKLTLNLYPNIYKYVREDGIEKESEDHYFGVESTKTI